MMIIKSWEREKERVAKEEMAKKMKLQLSGTSLTKRY